MNIDDKDIHDPRNPVYQDDEKYEPELFHECPQCNGKCSCHEQPCSCCEDNQEEGEPVVSPEFKNRNKKWKDLSFEQFKQLCYDSKDSVFWFGDEFIKRQYDSLQQGKEVKLPEFKNRNNETT